MHTYISLWLAWGGIREDYVWCCPIGSHWSLCRAHVGIATRPALGPVDFCMAHVARAISLPFCEILGVVGVPFAAMLILLVLLGKDTHFQGFKLSFRSIKRPNLKRPSQINASQERQQKPRSKGEGLDASLVCNQDYIGILSEDTFSTTDWSYLDRACVQERERDRSGRRGKKETSIAFHGTTITQMLLCKIEKVFFFIHWH